MKKLMWNKNLAMDRNQEGAVCPNCEEQNIISHMKFLYISLDEMVLKCESSTCLFPFGNFKYKSVKDGSISTYQPSPQKTIDEILRIPNKTNLMGEGKIECTLPEVLHSSTDNPDPTNEILEDFDLTFFTDDHSMEVETYSQCDNSSGIKEEQLASLPDFSVINFEEYDAFKPVKKETERMEHSSNANVFSFDNMSLDPRCTSFESARQFLMPSSENFVNIDCSQENNIKADVDKTTTIEIHSVEILPQPVQIAVNQLSPTVNEIKVESKSESDTISKYLDMIKAKHKKVKTSKKKTPKIKSELEGTPLKTCDKISLKSNSPNRPLDILKTIGRLQ